jgi:cytochrome oxidase Cu insertion factor (SCO1/SenC/PrrC family)
MNKTIPILLWILVFIFGGITFYYLKTKRDVGGSGITLVTNETGVQHQQIPWKHFQHVPPFEMTNQDGEQFDSADLSGRPYVVSFFFAECPTICRDLNKQIQSLRERVDDPELSFVSISVDPKNDTPEVLNRYAADFDADVKDWVFLNGEPYKIKEVGEQSFHVAIDLDNLATHTESIMIVDRWGRFRDRFKWDDPYDMKRFLAVAKDLLAEQEPPLNESFESRNLMAAAIPSDLSSIKWIRDFRLTTQDDQPFFSRDLTGEVWIGNFFFSTCPSICKEQNEYLAGLQKRLAEHPAQIVSITTDADTDTTSVLRDYGRTVGADFDSWTFLTGNKTLIKRISAEFFGAHASENHHSSRLFVVDRWGQVRGDFDWQNAGDEVKMFKLIDELNSESRPAIQ